MRSDYQESPFFKSSFYNQISVMSEFIRALFFVLALSGVGFFYVSRSIDSLIDKKKFNQWMFLWIIVVSSAFLIGNLVLFVAFFVILMFFYPRQNQDGVTCYLLLLCTLPLLSVYIPFPGIGYLFQLTYPRMLCLILLFLPYFTHTSKAKFFSFNTDYWLMAYLIFIGISDFRDITFTSGLKLLFQNFLDIYLPYYMLSRRLLDVKQLDTALVAFSIGLVPCGFIAIFEALKHWHLFTAITKVISDSGHVAIYDNRGDLLRASGVFFSPIILAFALLLELFVLLYFLPTVKNKKNFYALMLVMGLGMLATVARGPLVAGVIAMAIFILTGPKAINNLLKMAMAGTLILVVLNLTESGKKFIDYLPFIGTARLDTIDYRERLIDNALIVFNKNPWFGSTTFLETPEMEAMRQGQGIIDLVNTFVQIGLTYGSVGIILFLAIFISLLIKCWSLVKRLPSSEDSLIRLGRVLFSILSGTLLTVTTVSSIDYIPVFYWTFIGISTAYIQIAEKAIKSYQQAQTLTKSKTIST